jgi:uncharacterized protein
MQSMIGSLFITDYRLELLIQVQAIVLLIGIVLFIINCYFVPWWLKTHKQGPLETIWHKATWISWGK